jgi:two-component system OmpR family response regulator
VLLIEDEERLREALGRGLRAEGHRVLAAGDGEKGFRLALDPSLDVIVCDLLLPKLNGFQICKRLREAGVWTPILMLTAKDGEWDEAEALDAGADDYLTKPFSFVVLGAHLRALARRAPSGAPSEAGVVQAGALRLDYRAGHCQRGEVTIPLSRRELAVLGVLVARAGRVVTKAELLAEVWGEDFTGDPNLVEVYVGYLRRKIDVPFGCKTIETVRGAGYRFVPEPLSL